MNENRFLWTKILIKIKTRDKKMFTKKFHEGGGEGGGGGWQFSWGKINPGKMPPRKIASRKIATHPPREKKENGLQKKLSLR